LETVKRGEYDSFDAPVNVDDDSDESTIILRLFEAYGGHGSVTLKVNRHIPVAKAYATNLLEDHTHDLELLQLTEEHGGGAVVKLDFRGFEVKTIKLVLGTPAPPPSQKKVSVSFVHTDSGFS
jgi:alpha-mannosidase